MKIKKIKTQRAWDLKLKVGGDCVDIIEQHEEGGEQFTVIPVEAIDEVIVFLVNAKVEIIKNEGK